MVGHYTEETGWRNNNILKNKLFAEYFAKRNIFETNSAATPDYSSVSCCTTWFLPCALARYNAISARRKIEASLSMS
jgi:hypothetical protein